MPAASEYIVAPVVCLRCCGLLVPSVPYRALKAEGSPYVPLDCAHCGQHVLTLMSRYKKVAEAKDKKPQSVVPLFANPLTLDDMTPEQFDAFTEFVAIYNELLDKGLDRFSILASLPEV